MNKKIFALGAIILLAISSLAFALARGPEDIDASPEVYNFDSCFAKTGISTDGIPSECTYDGKTYVQGENEKPVPTLYNRMTRYVYGITEDNIPQTLEKYKAHCASVGGVFNTCGSMCEDGVNCVKLCALTCENVLASDADVQYIVKGDKVEFEYESEDENYDSRYKAKYADGDVYEIESEFKIKNAFENGFNVEDIDGKVRTVNVLPEDAVRKAFDSDTPLDGLKIRLEEKEYNNVPKVIYNIDGDSDGKFLGLFKISARYQAQIDANTGDVLDWKGPWWAFLITGENKPVEYVEGDVIVNDYDSCVAVTGISTDGIPSECTYEGVVYTQKIKSSGEENIVDFASCVNAGYPVQETAPARCVYKDIIFVDIPSDSDVSQKKSVNVGGPTWMRPDLTNCEGLGGVYEEQEIYCAVSPCYPIKKCTLNGKVYTEDSVQGESMQKLCASVNGVFNQATSKCLDSNGIEYYFAMA